MIDVGIERISSGEQRARAIATGYSRFHEPSSAAACVSIMSANAESVIPSACEMRRVTSATSA